MAIKKIKNKNKKEEDKEELSLFDNAKKEKDIKAVEYAAHGKNKKYTKEIFKIWLTLPDQFKGTTERIIELLGITDTQTREILKIRSMGEFASEWNVAPQTLSRWRKEIEENSDFFADVKKQMRKLTRNVIGALYRKAIEEGDASRAKLWLQAIDDWREQLGVEHSGHVSNLTDEEKGALDDLISKNKTTEDDRAYQNKTTEIGFRP